jgi:uracil-DNA glycosylase
MHSLLQHIHPSWEQMFSTQHIVEQLNNIEDFLNNEVAKGKIIYPKQHQLFEAFTACSATDLRVVILGQDPYHGPQQAHGLSFSVQIGQAIPPSLQNIFKELQQDLGLTVPSHGCLTHWAKQGVLLLNASLSVEENKPMSHAKIGWHQLTDTIIQQINALHNHVVFMLWGKFAQTKKTMIDTQKHLILEAVHPSPLSVYRGFYGCKHFSKANEYLISINKKPIDWQII